MTQTPISRNEEKCSYDSLLLKTFQCTFIILSPFTSPHDGSEDIIFLPPSESHGQAGCVPVSDYCGWEWALLSTECWLYPLVSPPHCHYRPRVPAQPGLSLERRPMESLARRSDSGLTWYSLVSRKVVNLPVLSLWRVDVNSINRQKIFLCFCLHTQNPIVLEI